MLNMTFYDIESLKDLFSLCTYNPAQNALMVFYLTDVDITQDNYKPIINEIVEANKPLKKILPNFWFFDLKKKESNDILMSMLGKSDTYPIIPDYEDWDGEKFAYMSGYNSHNYDLTMLALYFEDTIQKDGSFKATTAEQMRFYNNCLFDPVIKPNMSEFLRRANAGSATVYNSEMINGVPYSKPVDRKYCTRTGYKLYDYWINSGKHIDVARLNEKQSRVALKRLLGMLGYQILEPDIDLSEKSNTKLTYDDIKNVLAYNVSDVINLMNLFNHDKYTSAFELKRQMIIDDPKLIYKRATVVDNLGKDQYGNDILKTRNLYEPDMKTIKSFRMTINSSSAQFAGQSLCPYDSLEDDPAVSFMFPAEEKAAEKGVRRRNILDETNEFIDSVLVPRAMTDEGREIISNLKLMIRMYKAVEGHNFHVKDADSQLIPPEDLNMAIKAIAPEGKISVPYMGPDGNATDCYVNFSVGGIHGAQYNKALYDADVAAYEHMKSVFDEVCRKYPDPLVLLTDMSTGKPKRRKTFQLDGVTYQVNEFIKSGSTLKAAEWKPSFLRNTKPTLFEKGGLKKKYVVTSFGKANHEDFVSYYPNLLIMMQAMKNKGLIDPETGKIIDHYEEIFGQKQAYKQLIKNPDNDDPSLAKLKIQTKPGEERNVKQEIKTYKTKQKGVKLVLNSASGAADSNYNTPILMNNRIIAMRIIGQLFAWRIGQEQALEGACVFSTNTDGLYTIFDEKKNDEILERVSKTIGIEIEPERLYIVSKDANNRIEMDLVPDEKLSEEDKKNILKHYEATNLSGGTLACGNGPDPEKSLAHPAVTDWGLAEYLKYAMHTNRMDTYDETVTKYLFNDYVKTVFTEKDKYLQMFQNIISSSSTTLCLNFGTKEPLTDHNTRIITPIKLQHYNRIFVVKPDRVKAAGQGDRITYIAAAYVRPNERPNATKGHNPLATDVLINLYEEDPARIHGLMSLKKLNGIELDTPCMIVNEALSETDFDPDWLDLEYYENAVKTTYMNNWMNGKDKDFARDMMESELGIEDDN